MWNKYAIISKWHDMIFVDLGNVDSVKSNPKPKLWVNKHNKVESVQGINLCIDDIQFTPKKPSSHK